MARTVDSQSTNQSSTLCAITTGLEKILEQCEIPDVRSRRTRILSVGRVIDPKYGLVVQLVRMLACHARGHGFKSRSGRHLCGNGGTAIHASLRN